MSAHIYEGPGGRIIGAIARLVPWSERADWSDEWCAELAHAHERRLLRGDAAWRVALSMRLRCVSALSDALWLRGRNGGTSMLIADLKSAWRAMRRRPGFAASIVVTLSLGIGGTTAMFSIIDPLMLRPLPYPEVARLVEVHTIHPGGAAYEGVDVEVWKTVRTGLLPRVFDRFEAGAPLWPKITGTFEPVEARAHAFTPGALPLLGARPKLGRLFVESDTAVGAPLVAVLSETFWRRVFFGDPAALGRTLTLDGKAFTVIGVLPASFKYPDGTVALWIPLPVERPLWRVNGFEAIARVREGVTRESAQLEVDALTRRMGEGAAVPFYWNLSVKLIENRFGKGVPDLLGLLAGAVACVLLIACVNAANLLLVHSTGRQTELAVRRSLGATSARLFRQLVTETLVLAVAGGVLGVFLAYAGVRAIIHLLPASMIEYTHSTIGVDGRVLAFTAVVSLLTGVVFGAGPALRAARHTRLVSSDRTLTASAAVRRLGGMLVVIELALSMMLLVGAGLLGRSFVGLLAVDPGYQPQGLAVLRINHTTSRDDTVRAELFYGALKERLLASPGITGVTVSDGLPPRPSGFRSRLTLEVESGEKRLLGDLRLPDVVVDHDYFAVLGIPIIAGRSFEREDTRSSPLSAIIDPEFAALLWPAGSPIGRRFRIAVDEPWLTVVGVAGDVKMMGPDDRAAPYALYLAASQQTPWRYRWVAVRTREDVGALQVDIRNVVRSLDPDQPILDLGPAEALFGESLQKQRFLLILMVVFTMVAVILAAIGVYGVVAYMVAQRTREIGLRIALGATPLSMVAAVLGSGLTLAVTGGLIGLAAALALSRFLSSLLFGIQPTDVPTLALVGGILGLVAGAATLVPAIRAGRTSPLETLRGG
ncbi:MAG: ABC transporter permease [Gemmatimonadota bacterium]